MGIRRQPLALLAAVKGADGHSPAELVELPGTQECCGFGGVFSVEHPELSAAMLERKIANIEKTGSEVVVACDAGCITNINGVCTAGVSTQELCTSPKSWTAWNNMSTSFRSHIRTALSDENLQIALDGNKERRLRGQGEAFASLATTRHAPPRSRRACRRDRQP